MKHRSISSYGFLVVMAILAVFISLPVARAEQVDTYKKIQELKPFFGAGKNILFDSSYEYSFVTLGARAVHWKLFTSRLMYMVRGQIPYVEVTQHERDRVSDVTIAPGAYFQFKNSSLHIENGFGIDADYIYRYQATVEYEHRLIQNLYWKIGSRYLHYKTGDVLLAYPGFIYYFGNHYITANYGFSLSEGRSDAHWGSGKINLALPYQINSFVGAAIGQRLFDIYPIEAAKQGGFILFTGIDYRIFENVKIRAGYSHSQEKPNFIKRSVDGGLAITF